MLNWSNTTSSGVNQNATQGQAYVSGAAPYSSGVSLATSGGRFLWCPTARNLTDNSGANDSIVNAAQRTATTCYMRGVAENLRIQTSSGVPWYWRRICFTSKGPTFNATVTADSPNEPLSPALDTSVGIVRLWNNEQVIVGAGNTTNTRESVLFKGVKNNDWDDPITAPLDNTRVTVKYDKTRVIKSGNANGTVLDVKLWHPMNKNLVYDDDENGEATSSAYFSTDAKAGMGDYYIYDFFVPGAGAGASDLLRIGGGSTMYWHEK